MAPIPIDYDLSLCRAALHAGAIGAEGGQIVVQPRKASFFPAVLRNGVEAGSCGGGMGFSVSATADGRRSGSPVFDGRTLDICPTNYGSFPEDAPPLTCGCDAASVKQATSMAPIPIDYDSSLCRAALHAGVIGAEGGQIVVSPEKASFFPAVLRNGVEAGSYGGGMGFSVSATADGRRSGSPVFDGRTLDICPTNYGSFPEDAPPLTCGCDAASVKRGNVYGANPYRYSSSLCRAALHAGAIGAEGGQIVVQPRKASFFPAVLRNGVEAGSYGGGMGFSVSAKDGRQSGSPVFDGGRSISARPTMEASPRTRRR